MDTLQLSGRHVLDRAQEGQVRSTAPFRRDDLEHLDALLDRATAVVSMQEVFACARHPWIIGLRHDVDNAIEPAVEFAAWEAERGYRSTYYILHTAPYWEDKPLLRRSLDFIRDAGHEIGIHNNAIAEATVTGDDPRAILAEAILELREYGHSVTGTVAHGASECYDGGGNVRVVNDELFLECARPGMGLPDRTVGDAVIRPTSLADFGLTYDANWLPRGAYISDSGGRWSKPFRTVGDGFPFDLQLHMLVHPDWWAEAFETVTV
jgi:hypothetical protein